MRRRGSVNTKCTTGKYEGGDSGAQTLTQFAELGAVRIPGRQRLTGNRSDEQELGKGEGSDSILSRRKCLQRHRWE